MLNLFFAIAAKLPSVFITCLAELVILLLRFGMPSEKNRFFKNIERVYSLPRHSPFAQDFLRDHIRHQVYCQLETIIGIYNPSRIRIHGAEELKQLVSQIDTEKTGLVIATAHLGSWEFVAKYTSLAMEQPFHALAKPSKYKAVTQFLDSMRGRMNTEVLWTGKPSLLKNMIKVLKSGQPLGFVMDQKPENRKGPIVDFLGLPTEFVTGPASLAIKCRSAIVGVFCVRVGPFEYRIHSEKLHSPEDSDENIEELTQTLASRLTYWIKSYPEQWTWSYKRWRD